ncbi:hypothetical protein N7508_003221 [Penicillium antarcticum]|uniref:uncharacterized protein n=1 Tax=Penicillium antarcticum TaxID=416450 RepID=UPI002394E805|nr:uncharacterized protein N7508_003221 [Penicillium antarcticum]KAJ5312391.1 hypothetical protein N7508_003221 [Penicillium antarcticum]
MPGVSQRMAIEIKLDVDVDVGETQLLTLFRSRLGSLSNTLYLQLPRRLSNRRIDHEPGLKPRASDLAADPAPDPDPGDKC